MKTCLVVEDSRLARKELVTLIEKTGLFTEIKQAQDAEEAKTILESYDPDLLFLDIHLPGKNGFEFLESLDYSPEVIFTTAYDEYAIKSFDYNTIDYLLKPIKESRLLQALEKLKEAPKESIPSKGLDRQVFVRDGERCWFVKLSEIRLFESVGNYSKVFFKDEKPMILKSLSYLESVLDEDVFFRVNRQQIVNLNYVVKMDNWFNGKLKITLNSGEEVEVSRRQSQRIKSMFSL